MPHAHSRPASRGQAQVMIGILALEDEASAANIRSLHYDWLVSYVSPTGVYQTLSRLRSLGWVRGHFAVIGMKNAGYERRTKRWRLTEGGRRALISYYADALWFGHANGRQYAKITREAELLLRDHVARVKAGLEKTG